MSDNSVTIYVDGVPYQVDGSDNLLAGVLSSKLDLPYFCWHPSMGSVGACRQCAVTVYNDETQQQGRLAMACMTPITDGMRIGLGDNYSSHFREQVIAAMMTNHPHDCPVCAEGGECHLQDMTVMTGHNQREYVGDKRTFTNQDLGPHISHEMNRCITCYRCVRFYKDYAGGKDFGVYGSKNRVYFGRQQDGVLESEFAGNLVEVCPTGVFTDKPFSAHYARKWDLQSAPSICKGCAVGCNISVGERYGCVRRVVNRYNDDINGYFLCDKGRFGFGYVNSDDRIHTAKGINQEINNKLSTKDVQLSLAKYKGQRFVAIGSERASLETNTALKHLFGAENFCSGLTIKQSQLLSINTQMLNHVSMLSVKQIEQADCVLVLGEDLTQTSPRIALALRQTVRNAGLDVADKLRIPRWQDEAVRTAAGKTLTPLFICDVGASKLDDVASTVNYSSPDDIANITQAINAKLSHHKTLFASLSKSLTTTQLEFVEQAATALASAKQPLVISGHSLEHVGLAEQCLNLATGFAALSSAEPNGKSSAEQDEKTRLNFAIMPKQANSLGLASLLSDTCLTLEQVCQQASANQIDGLLVCENELANLSDTVRNKLFASVSTIIALDHNQSVVTDHADVILPVAAFSESQGLLVNYQGRAQCFYPSFAPKLPILPSWRIITMLDAIIGKGKLADSPTSIDNFTINDFWQTLQRIEARFPDTSAFIAEQFLLKTARQTHRASGRTAMTANQSVHESKATIDNSSPYKFSMEGIHPQNDHSLNSSAANAMPYTWAPGWNSNQSISKYQQQVGEGLVTRSPEVQIYDPNTHSQSAPDTISAEQAGKGIKQVSPESIDNLTDQIENNGEEGSDNITFIPAKHIFANDYLGLKGIEFEMLSPIPYVELSNSLAKHLGLSDCSHINMQLTDSTQTCQLKLTSNIAANCALVYLFESDRKYIELSNSQLTPATTEQVLEFEQALANKLSCAEENKQNLLARLKQNDQFIPIRLMAGGLDDL
ncbi:NADH-quinone oxidoreductase subunit NuoG [Thalassotalea fonticola]|uniref:NADH-quinone oxidoreductase subunit G n=1 Tax=Thalassotalea fonticola TaxID=3065649 RepID=A0ABZ0GT91_9GAMM|nr:NADH-quinone oxidoreductase subunit NuoG [Colwelliaceae bacterium S1-1]